MDSGGRRKFASHRLGQGWFEFQGPNLGKSAQRPLCPRSLYIPGDEEETRSGTVSNRGLIKMTLLTSLVEERCRFHALSLLFRSSTRGLISAAPSWTKVMTNCHLRCWSRSGVPTLDDLNSSLKRIGNSQALLIPNKLSRDACNEIKNSASNRTTTCGTVSPCVEEINLCLWRKCSRGASPHDGENFLCEKRRRSQQETFKPLSGEIFLREIHSHLYPHVKKFNANL